MKTTLSLSLVLLAAPLAAEENRQLDAHEHGVGALNIAIDGARVAMAFEAPGADIVGFEYEAESDSDRAAVEAAIATLMQPQELFGFAGAAACSVTRASAELEGGAHDDHDEEDHDDHGHDDDHDDHEDHDEHEDAEGGHTEFHAVYEMTCANPGALSEITFGYFKTFENAEELEVQIVTPKGAQAFEVDGANPVIDLEDLI